VTSEEDLEGLELPDVRKAGSLPIAMEFSRLQQKWGMQVTVVLGGNFTVAGNICPVGTLCRWMLKRPGAAHRLLQFASDHILDVVRHWVDTFGAEKVIPNLWEPLAANNIISPRQFATFALPYIKETNEKILALGVRHILYHICGEHTMNLPYWAQVPMGDPGLVTFGHQVELHKAIEHFGDTCIVVGNVNPSVIQSGTAQEVYELSRRCIEVAKSAPRGFMLMSGCELPPMAPPYNAYQMTKAIRDFGWYS
jgi:uroporphyrinogen decarboxylase